MAATKRLTARRVETEKRPGRHADGNGLYLVVDPSGARRWLFLFRWQGKLKEKGLGGWKGGDGVSLAEARSAADKCRAMVRDHINPIEASRAERKIPTFGEAADSFVAAKESEWRNQKHRYQWAQTLAEYAMPIRAKRIDQIDTDDVLRVLRPIWSVKNETASRLRGRIERILDAAKAMGHRTGENPARWRGHLDHLLPKRQKLTRGHHAAMPFDDVPAYMIRLRESAGTSARALEFVILTAARSGEVLGARWTELDLTVKVWTVPGARMKTGREHRVPLSPRALEILEAQASARVSDFVFPGLRPHRPLSGMALEMLMRRHGVGATAHGMRSAFRDWCGEKTAFPRELAEMALSHTIGDLVEQAYRRGDALERRRKLMESWGAYCVGPRNVVPLQRPA